MDSLDGALRRDRWERRRRRRRQHQATVATRTPTAMTTASSSSSSFQEVLLVPTTTTRTTTTAAAAGGHHTQIRGKAATATRHDGEPRPLQRLVVVVAIAVVAAGRVPAAAAAAWAPPASDLRRLRKLLPPGSLPSSSASSPGRRWGIGFLPPPSPWATSALVAHRHRRSSPQQSESSWAARRKSEREGDRTTWSSLASSILTPFEANLFDGDDDEDDDNATWNPYRPNNESGDDDEDDEAYLASSSSSSPLAVPSHTRLVLGVNKYSHDATLVAADATTGHVLFGMSKERITRRKHDGGNVASLVELCLDQLNLTLDSIDRVVMNNHHHRILPMEKNLAHMEWESGLNINGGAEPGYDDPYNLLPSAWDDDEYDDNEGGRRTPPQFVEVSHHLAHAYSTVAQAPFDSGLCLVADGMGEAYRTMLHAKVTDDPTYVSDLLFDEWACVPTNLSALAAVAPYDYREAESLYTFRKTNSTLDVRPIWKRFTAENTPPTLYNHGFENMDSVGAVYSRASSTIFGDWNACGKVMGLAPWASHQWEADDESSPPLPSTIPGSRKRRSANGGSRKAATPALKPGLHEAPVMSGSLWVDSSFCIDRTILLGVPLIARNDPDLFEALVGEDELVFPSKQRPRYDFDDNDGIRVPGQPESSASVATAASATATLPATRSRQRPTRVALDAIAVAHRVQTDLEKCLMDLVAQFKGDATNLCLAGGVALNSVANGRLARELGFDRTFVSPYPGDDGIAMGCCAFGLFGNHFLDGRRSDDVSRATRNDQIVWRQPMPPYLGPMYVEADLLLAINSVLPWIQVETIRNENERIQRMAQEIESGGVVAWFHSRSELGPRALGHRSILADPRKKGLVRFINQAVKSRESFRPFAPSVLVEEAASWFHLGVSSKTLEDNVSPFMSFTAMVHSEKRALIPAVTHIDGSSRLQTVTRDAEPLYYKLIQSFFELTGVPLVLNTSFNTLPSEPIVETPSDAIRSFLYSMGSIEMLVLGDHIIHRKTPEVRLLLGEVDKKGDFTVAPVCPKRAGRAEFQSSFELGESRAAGTIKAEADLEVRTATKVRMPARPLYSPDKNEWFELLDDLEGELLAVCDGTVSLNDLMAQFTASPDNESEEARVDDAQELLQNIVHRLVRLFEHTLISW